MWKPFLVTITFIAASCVTVNIYFPAAAVERAADQIVKETWGTPGDAAPKTQPQTTPAPGSKLPLSLITEAYAQEPDINISNPAIRALKDSIKARSDSIKPYMDRGNVGITQDGLLTVRGTEGLSLKERAEVQQLVEAENRDRESLYSEIAKANNFAPDAVPKIKRIFAKSWMDQARPGWWIQEPPGNWRKK
jgi:uncharacterized protein YdbL (DUF1318 family)